MTKVFDSVLKDSQTAEKLDAGKERSLTEKCHEFVILTGRQGYISS